MTSTPIGTTQLSKHFSLAEMTRSSTGLANVPSPEQIENLRYLCETVLEPIRLYFGNPVTVTSGYRSQAVNTKVGGVDSSQHRALTGNAACDFTIKGITPAQIVAWVATSGLPFDQVINEFDVWVHISAYRPRKSVLKATKNAAGATQYNSIK